MKISTFCIVKNEVDYIGFSTMAVLPFVDEIVWADGNSTDGTIELVEHIQREYDPEGKIKLFKDRDCKNLKGDYQRLFNWTLRQCTGDWLIFLHCDMIFLNPEKIRTEIERFSDALRINVLTRSIAGESRDVLIKNGRGDRWSILMRNAFGLHQHGNYGSVDEDFYFKDITGNEHNNVHGKAPTDCIMWNPADTLPYPVGDSDLVFNHYCETKDHARRLDRMKKCLRHQGVPKDQIDAIAETHPRVTLKDGQGFTFEKRTDADPEVFTKYGKEFGGFKRCT